MILRDYIRNISREAVVDGVKNIKRYHIGSQKLISDTNPLITNSILAVKNHSDATKSYRIKQAKINTFLAASSLAHLLDGWTYLSNSFNALLSGDEATSIHLGYYAELRSAMAILATEGLGVFNDKHLGAFSTSTNLEYPTNYYKGNPPNVSYKQPSSATHLFVWDAMEKWSNSSYKQNDEILKIFKVKNKNFFELTEYFHPSTTVSTLHTVQTIKSWLKEWCFDIRSYRSDRNSRNNVSYRPQRISKFNERINFKNILNEINSFWSVISPSNTDKFSLLDMYLLRKLFASLFSGITTTETRSDLITRAFSEHGINDRMLFDFLDFQSPYAADHIIFNYASIRKTSPLSIIARATLLLRVAVGLVSQLYKSGGINKLELDFVWNNYAVNNGFWQEGSAFTDFNQLWSEIQTSLDDLKIDINSLGADNNLYSIKERNPEGIIYAGQINRACLWGLDL